MFGVYIPKDLTDVFVQLNSLIKDEKTKAAFKSFDEETAAKKLHFGFGRWMIHNWGFYEGSRLSVFLNQIGLHNPDDMATFLITTYHRNLNQKTLDVKALVESILEKRKEEEKQRKLQGEIIHEEKRLRKN